MTRRSRRKAREDTANFGYAVGGVNNYAETSTPSVGSGQDDYLRQQAFGLVGGVGQGEAAKSKVTEAEAVFRWLKYGPEKHADPTVQQIVADVVNSERSLQHAVTRAERTAHAAQRTADEALTALGAAYTAIKATAIVTSIALLVGAVALIVALLS